MKLSDNDFALFGLPERFALDRADLDARWRRLQASAHPDKFAAEGAAAQRVAMQWSVRINEAYRRLREPLARAAYLCELRGVPIEAERNTAMPATFLGQQMAWREALDEASDESALEALLAEVHDAEQSALAELQSRLDGDTDTAAAAERVRALMFITRFRADVQQRLHAHET
ncbi:MAG TPA: Fe-S protein assembly co-chaperone HscB [Burkholderiaceae bacterium]|jgi:molecular chaperone HscB|nr:Fe-S protein assembly co-chaperone HscB [Burkholderiaceae bacterium]